MTGRPISQAELGRLKDDHPCDEVAARWVVLRRHGRRMIGPCPIHSPDRTARDSTAFAADAAGWVCATCADGGDVIKLVQRVQGLDFLGAVDWLGGVTAVDGVEEARRAAERAARKEQAARTGAEFRERERARVYDIWRRGTPIAGTAVADYLTLRLGGAPLPGGLRLRCLEAMPYWASGAKDAVALARAPAMLAPIIGRDGKFSGLHISYIDLGAPKGKLDLKDASGAALPAKKVRGSSAGGRIELVPRDAPARLIIGEGIEKVLAVWAALAADAAIDHTAFWTSVDLGNLGGRAAASVPHPSRKNATGHTARVPGPVPDLAAAGIPIPDSVSEIVILGDATSDRFTTHCAIARAAARWAREGRRITVAWAWPDADFDDVLRQQTDMPAALARIAAAIAAAVPVEAPADQVPQAEQTKPRRQARPQLSRDRDDAAPGSDPPAAARRRRARPVVVSENVQPSQPGASEAAGIGGAGRDAEDPGDLDRRLAWLPLTDLGNAERLVARYTGKLIYCAAIGWLCWDGRRWCIEGADQQVMRAEHATVRAIQHEASALEATLAGIGVAATRDRAEKLVGKLRTWGRKSEQSAAMGSLKKNASAYLAVVTAELDADPLAINVLNGTLLVRREWSDGDDWPAYGDFIRLKPHEPRDLITKLANVAFDQLAARPQFDKFLAEVQPDPATRRFIQAWKGYSLTADASEHRMAIFIGKGRNGKSVCEDATAYVAGDYAETVPIETFLASGREANANAPSPARALLHNARMVRTSEPNKSAALDEGFIKLVTGGEPIQARNLNLPLFRFYPVLKLTVSGNHRPKIGGTDEGIWSRVTLVPWPVIIPPERRDRRLTEKLRGEASGILNWMLDGLSDWMEHGLVLPEEVRTATAEYRRDSDQLGRFLELAIVADPEGRVQSSVLLTVFNAWARVNGGTEWTGRGLTNAMTERGFKKDKSSVMFWLHIKLTKHEGDFPDSGRVGGSSGSSSSQSSSVGSRRRGDDDEMTF